MRRGNFGKGEPIRPSRFTIMATAISRETRRGRYCTITEPSHAIRRGCYTFSQRYSLLVHEGEAVVDNVNEKQAKLEEEDFSFQDHSAAALPPKPHLSYLAYYPYAELPPNKRPADIVLD